MLNSYTLLKYYTNQFFWSRNIHKHIYVDMSFFLLCKCNNLVHTPFPIVPFPLGPDFIFSSVQFSRSVVCDSSQLHWPQHSRPPCPSPTPWVYSNSCPLSQWCHPTISSSLTTNKILNLFRFINMQAYEFSLNNWKSKNYK